MRWFDKNLDNLFAYGGHEFLSKSIKEIFKNKGPVKMAGSFVLIRSFQKTLKRFYEYNKISIEEKSNYMV